MQIKQLKEPVLHSGESYGLEGDQSSNPSSTGEVRYIQSLTTGLRVNVKKKREDCWRSPQHG